MCTPNECPLESSGASLGGLGVALLIKEPSTRTPRANCVFWRGYILTTRRLRAGEELTAYRQANMVRFYPVNTHALHNQPPPKAPAADNALMDRASVLARQHMLLVYRLLGRPPPSTLQNVGTPDWYGTLPAIPTPPQHRWLDGSPSGPLRDPEKTLDRAIAIADSLESLWGLSAPSMANSWDTVAPGTDLCLEIDTIWPSTTATLKFAQVSHSHNVARIINILPQGCELIYVTDHHVWAHTMNLDGSKLEELDPEPISESSAPVILGSFSSSTTPHVQAELRLQLQWEAAKKAGSSDRTTRRVSWVGSTVGLSNRKPLSYNAKMRNGSGRCPACKGGIDDKDNPCQSEVTARIGSAFGLITFSCHSVKRPANVRLNPHLREYVFGDLAPQPHPNPKSTRPPQGRDSAPVWTDPSGIPTSDPTTKSCSHKVEGSHGITVLSYNTDDAAANKLSDILGLSDNTNADVVLLQDIGKARWSQQALLQKGWLIHRHDKVAILLRMSTAGRIVGSVSGLKKKSKVWRSNRFRSMGVTLNTPEGSLFIATAYLPPNVDAMPQDPGHPDTASILAQHDEIAHLVSHHAHAILGMDANETTSNKARIQLRQKGPPSYSGTQRGPGLDNSNMTAYASMMVDCH
jgi:hypothetical protein